VRALLVLLAACTTGASPSLGLDMPIQLAAGGQFRPGPFPADAGGQPAIQVQSQHANVAIAQLTERMIGQLGTDARVAIIGLGLDPAGCSPTSSAEDGAWIVPAGAPDITSSGVAPTVNVKYGLAPDVPVGAAQLLLAGADAQGTIGARACYDITAVMATSDDGQVPELAITASWPGAADLDLHVIDPEGHEAFSEVPNTYQPTPGTVDPPGAYLQGGILDHDSNANCTRERFPHEDIVWHQGHAPPPGTYTVRVEARAMCGDPDVPWHVTAYRQQTLLGEARGLATADDVAFGIHGRGAGITALTFTVP